MKKRYMMPAMRAVKIEKELMQFVSGEQTTTPVDPSKPKDPGSAMSRDDRGFLLWDEE
jgi:hypothetical protein